ncbi:MAG TPA: bifunctional [glutamine synthetase] adenylyltransferase/[glutamine synthetase]-adenylyl-L-tyrosine phosphorylase [Egibacteraceae bacterium]|nr:bifunctional [glutamine synthetase] adenylyltransferase/[glutamine synthetase]-adenylyl-L-tyrosine phosphorylase [Egibacteraceae bacterium]
MGADASRASLAAAGLDADAIAQAELAAGDPEAARRALAAVAGRDPLVLRAGLGHELVRRIGAVAGASDALGALLGQSAAAVAVLAGDLAPQDAATVRGACDDALDGSADPARDLARVQRLGLLRIAARDLLGMADTPTVAAELADLAQGVLASALDQVVREVGGPGRLAVIAMGKLGGRELNYVSDVDVMFVHDGDFAAAAKLCERYLRLLSTVSPEGRAYEVDANLRPEGKDGPLSRSISGFRTYYERWARNWEFQALLKARPIAGDPELGQEFLAAIEPFVWPDRRPPEAIAEIQAMKTVVEESAPVRKAGDRQVKLAPGGLRDIEFAVQLLQLVHGRHDPALRSANTLESLAALAAGGYVDEEDAEVFDEAYRFLRTVEHRLQLVRLRRTHTIPEDAGERRRLARSMGFRDSKDDGPLERFDRELARVRGVVRQLHEKLFYRPLLDRFAQVGADDALPVSEGGLAEQAARERLEALGFANATAALAHLDALAGGVTRRARLLRTLLPAILPTLADQPDPDGGLAAFRSLADRLQESPTFLRTLRDNPPVGEILAQSLGRSRLVGQWLERQPEVFGMLGDPGGLAQALEPADYRRLADGLLRRGQDPAAGADALRRMRRREAVRIAVRDLMGLADSVEVVKELSGLAQACLEAGLCLALDGHDEVRMAVIGMGKLGGAELGYASDLDVLLVFDGPRGPALAAASRLLKLLGDITPEGKAFVVDPNLRPEGKDGPLARTLESYAAYYERWAEPWELQALTQARPVAGDPQLGHAFVEMVAPHVYPSPVPAARLQAIRLMKARVERERAGGGRGGARMGERADVKLGPGGLADIEWTVQLLQIKHGAGHASLRVPGALSGVEALAALGLLGEDDADWLRDGLRLLWALRNALYLAGFRDTQTLPANPEDQRRVARMLGWDPLATQAFLEELSRTMRRVRRVHERAFYDA